MHSSEDNIVMCQIWKMGKLLLIFQINIKLSKVDDINSWFSGKHEGYILMVTNQVARLVYGRVSVSNILSPFSPWRLRLAVGSNSYSISLP